MEGYEIFRKTVGYLGTNCYIFVNHDTGKCVVFDPGDDANELIEIFDTPAFKLEGIFLTHGHFDHIGAVKALKDKYDVPVYASEIEQREVLSKVNANLTGEFGLPFTVNADVLLKDGQELDILGLKMKCILTPGHTSGGMCYYFADAQSLISGDTLFLGSTGRTDFPTGSMSEIVHSIKEKLFVLPDETKVYPGHNDMTTIGFEKKNNPFVQ